MVVVLDMMAMAFYDVTQNMTVCFPKKVESKEFHEIVHICKIVRYKYFMVETKTTFSETCSSKKCRKRVHEIVIYV